jgi:hypothetical protein
MQNFPFSGAYSFGRSQRKNNEATFTPGPGEYPNKDTKSKIVTTFSKTHREHIAGTPNPGTGTYDPKFTAIEKIPQG